MLLLRLVLLLELTLAGSSLVRGLISHLLQEPF